MREGYLEAAVALVLRGGPSLDLLVIKRARSERDPWSGHMALPGGRRDAIDRTLLDTASRETLEETGVDLERFGSSLGRLDIVAPVSRRLPKLTISPYVFGVSHAVAAHVASAEVERIHWVPLDELRAPEAQATVEIPLPGGTTPFPCFRVADDVIWGLTYRILRQFLKIYRDPASTEPEPT